MRLKHTLKTAFALLCLLFAFSSSSYAENEAEGTAVEQAESEVSYAVFMNPRVHRSSSSIYALRIDDNRVKPGRDIEVSPGFHSIDLVFNGQREAFEARVEFEFKAGVTYRPKYRRVDVKGLEHISVRVIDAKTKKVVAKARPYLPRYSRRGVNPRRDNLGRY